jgi:hypothetical protein
MKAELSLSVLAHRPVADIAPSACCCGMLMLSIAITPNNRNAATLATIANIVSVAICKKIAFGLIFKHG